MDILALQGMTKTAVSASWIRERAVSGLAKRGLPLEGKEQEVYNRVKALKTKLRQAHKERDNG